MSTVKTLSLSSFNLVVVIALSVLIVVLSHMVNDLEHDLNTCKSKLEATK